MQRTPFWFEQRRNKITASNVGACLGLVSYVSRQKAYERALGSGGGESQAKEEVNPACAYGIENEPVAIRAYESVTQNKVVEAPFVIHSEIDWLGASPDGYIGETGLLEIKCPYYSRTPHKNIPLHYYLQIIVQLECCGRSYCDFYSWTPGEANLIKVKADPAFFKWLYFTHLTTLYDAIRTKAGNFPTLRNRDELKMRIAQSMQTHIVNAQPSLCFPAPEPDPFTSSNDEEIDGAIDVCSSTAMAYVPASDLKRKSPQWVSHGGTAEPPSKSARFE